MTGAFLLYSLVSGRLRGTIVTAPMVFIAMGFVVGAGGLGVASIDVGHSGIHLIAELTLMLVLFTDAARIDLGQVRRDHNLPVRMLTVGLPLTIAAGVLVGSGVSPRTQLFLGWFGPRGLASILFVLLILEDTAIIHRTELLEITVLTVALSALLHGATAAPLAAWYGRRAQLMGECAENKVVPELPLREGHVSIDNSGERTKFV